MPSLIDLRRRIRSVKNTEQITKAMKMVSAAKLRRAQERVVAARPYANLMREMLAAIERARPCGRIQFQPHQSIAEVFSGSRGRAGFTHSRGPQRPRLLSPPQRKN